MPDVSVVIVNWNGLDELKACLESLRGCGRDLELIVVDNGSTDGSVAYLRDQPGLRLVENAHNTGYAPANNAGIAQASAEFVLLLNNDTRVAPGFLEPMLDAMREGADVGACQARLLTTDDPPRVDGLGSYLTWSGFLYHYRYGKPDTGTGPPFEIFAAKGAAMLVRRAALDRVGAFDDDFFAYLEDSDLSWRIWLNGWRILCVPASCVWHRGGVTARRLPSALVTFHSFKNRLCMLLKNPAGATAWRILPPHLLLVLGLMVIELARGRPGAAGAIARALGWNLRRLPATLRKRREVQRRVRRLSDRALRPRLWRRVRPSYYYYLWTDLSRYRD
jgi:GT2 family glycosyltransferase